MKASESSDKRRDGLVGKYFFLNRNKNEAIHYGKVISSHGAEHFLVKYLGSTIKAMELFHISTMIGWTFYNSLDDLCEDYKLVTSEDFPYT